MTATNHALTGTVIGLAVAQPLIALPAAFLSHFVCDALPHYASADPPENVLKTKGFRNYLLADAGFCGLIVLVLAVTRPEYWLLAAFCAFLAASPDFLWINRYIKTRAGLKWHPSRLSRWALDIQWFAKPIGALFEVAWAAAAIIIIATFIRP